MGARLKTYPVMSFHLSIKGDASMDYKVIEKKEFPVTGVKSTMNLVNDDEDFNGIMQMWSDLTEEKAAHIMSFSNGGIDGLIGVSFNNDGKTFDYFIGCMTDETEASGLATLLIPAATWGIFESVGALPDSIVNTWQRIFAEWFPASGYESIPLPTIEVYSDADSASDDCRCEIWAPITKRNPEGLMKCLQ